MPARILIVEDDADMRTALADKLMHQYEIIQAEDGEQGMAKLLRQRPNLVILDLMLPKMDGFQLLEAIQGQVDLTKTPVVIYSNLSKNDSVQRAKDLSVNDFYIKSQTQADEVCQRVEELLKQQQ